MSDWRYIATRFNGDGTETLVDPDVPLQGANIDEVLSGDNGLSGSIDPVYARLRGPDGLPIFDEWGTGLYAEKDGEIRGGGILTHSEFTGPAWSLEANGLTSYARDMPWTAEGEYHIQVDPLDMVRRIWSHLQSQPGGNIGLQIDPRLSGVKIGTELEQVEFDSQEGPVSFEAGPFKLNWYETHDLAGKIDDLATETPFDYHERHYWDGDEIKHYLDFGVPMLGRKRDDLRFTLGVNIFDEVSVVRSGEDYASGTLVLGAGEGASMIKSLQEPPTRPRNRLRRIAVVQSDMIKAKYAADIRAAMENQWRSKLDDVSSFTVINHPNAPLGAAQIGDFISIDGQADWLEVDLWVRIMGINYSPEDSSKASYSVVRVDRLVTT